MQFKKKKILIVAPAWIGDMNMAQALFQLLRVQDPEIQVDVIAPQSTYPLLEFMPEINHAILFNGGHGKLGWRERYRLGKVLRSENYDQAIILPNSWKSALIPFFAKITRRTAWLGEQRFGLINDWRRLNKKKFPLMIQRFVALAFKKKSVLPVMPHPKLLTQSEKLEKILAKFELKNISQRVLALCPGAEYGSSKRWPAEYYAQVAKKKIQAGWQVWLIGSPKEMEAGAIIQQYTDKQCVNLIGKTNLIEAVNILSIVDRVVCNDSGLMHIAAALGRQLIAIFGSSSPEHTPPLSDKAKIIYLGLYCSPCFQRECPLRHLNCLREITSKQILEILE